MGINLNKLEELTLRLEKLRDALDYIPYTEAHNRFRDIEKEFSDYDIPFKMDWVGFANGEEEPQDETSFDDYDYFSSY